MRFEQIGDDRRPPVWRTLLLVVLVAFLSVPSVVFSPVGWATQHAPDGFVLLVAMVGLLASISLPVALFWRHRHPFVLTMAAALVPIVLPIGNSLAFALLACLIGRRRGPAVRATGVGVALSSTWVVVADALAQPRAASFAKVILGPTGFPDDQPMDLAVSTVVVSSLVIFALTIGAGYLVRWRRLAQSAVDAAATERAASGRLGDEVARRQERERIAREVHDAMGHRLSLLNLHAGALELNAGDDPRLKKSASLVRQSAGEAMDDLRSLLQVLREPLGDDQVILPLTRLPEVVRDSFGAGQVVNSSIFISEVERADPTLARAVYRIVQELLTNARKHAPGQPVLLSVEGGPTTGVVIEARNPNVGRPAPGDPGSARGLKGIAERAELLGGLLEYGLDEGGATFRVRVALPWREASGPR